MNLKKRKKVLPVLCNTTLIIAFPGVKPSAQFSIVAPITTLAASLAHGPPTIIMFCAPTFATSLASTADPTSIASSVTDSIGYLLSAILCHAMLVVIVVFETISYPKFIRNLSEINAIHNTLISSHLLLKLCLLQSSH